MKNSQNLLRVIFDASYVTTGTMDDAGYPEWQDVDWHAYKQIDASRAVEREAFVLISLCSRILTQSVCDIDSKPALEIRGIDTSHGRLHYFRLLTQAIESWACRNQVLKAWA